MYDQYKKNAMVMSSVLALVAMTGMMFIRQTVYSATRGSIENVRLVETMQNLDLSGIPVRAITVSYKTTGSPFSNQFRSIYVAVSDSDMTEPTEWAEIQACRAWGKVDFWPEERCTLTYPKVSEEASTFWIRVTTNNPDGSPRCGYGVTPYPSEYCGDTETLHIPVTP